MTAGGSGPVAQPVPGVTGEALRRVIDRVEPELGAGDRILHVESVPLAAGRRPPSAVRELLGLAGARTSPEIGRTGPVIAAGLASAQSGNAHLRRYEAVFGRDSLRVALTLAQWRPQLLEATVAFLAGSQGRVEHLTREEEPGRIVHELRDPLDPVAVGLSAEFGWDWPYYGSVDATPLFVTACARAIRRRPDFGGQTVVHRDGDRVRILDAMSAAVEWLEHRLDANRHGLLVYRRAFPGALENQVWRDSWDGLSHSDGSLPDFDRAIASLHAQAVAYEALVAAARAGCSDEPRRDRLADRAAQLRSSIESVFRVSDAAGEYFAVGADQVDNPSPHPLGVRSSDMGHLLPTGVLDGSHRHDAARRQQLVAALMAPDMLCAAGIRTLSTAAARFHPGGYHVGSSWPWDTAFTAGGMRRWGFEREAADLESRVLSVVARTGLFPEFARGDVAGSGGPLLTDYVVDIHSARDGRTNRWDQPPQEIQAWTVSAVLDIKWRHAGRGPSAPAGRPTADRRATSP